MKMLNLKPFSGPPSGGSQVIQQVRKFAWDLLGTLLLLLSALIFLGTFRFTQGVIINPMVGLIKQGIGWGIYPFIIVLALLGIACFRHIAGKSIGVTFGQILALEGLFFCLISLVSIFGGMSLERSLAGLDGGVIGWGLAQFVFSFLPAPLGTIFLILLGLLFLVWGLGISRILSQRLHDWTAATARPIPTAEEARAYIARRELHKPIASDAQRVENLKPQAMWRDDRLPPLNLLVPDQNVKPDDEMIRMNALTIEKTLSEFGIPARVIGYRMGPTVTQYALEPGFIERQGPDGNTIRQKVRVSQISTLSKDLALSLSAERLRIEAPVPGSTYMGIEVPNSQSAVVHMRGLLESDEFRRLASPLALALGRSVSGEGVVGDLARMPHLLIAGTTGSGKSVCIAAITACLVMNNTPEDLKMVMLDPKMVELVRFNGLPHLLGKVETELERMLAVLRWAQAEMDARYRMLESVHARDLNDYNRKMQRKKQPTLPRIVLLIDELADLMMTAPEQTEHSLVRLAQMARATGIHLVVATQRPSTDVVTGLIKANFPARISFTVASSVDSRVVLDANGAETLLGKGDMLFLDPEVGTLQRAQGAMIMEQEVEKIMEHWHSFMKNGEIAPAPWESMIEKPVEEDSDALVEQAIEVVKKAGKASASLLQRRLRIGYPRAARLIDELEDMGVVGPGLGSGKDREVLIEGDGDEDLDEIQENEFDS
jgi:S-DNA-T family DNA segregation ATPase FtsK/SpoIIIE